MGRNFDNYPGFTPPKHFSRQSTTETTASCTEYQQFCIMQLAKRYCNSVCDGVPHCYYLRKKMNPQVKMYG